MLCAASSPPRKPASPTPHSRVPIRGRWSQRVTVLQLAARLVIIPAQDLQARLGWTLSAAPQPVQRANRGLTLRSLDSPLGHSIRWPAAPPPPSVLGITHQGQTPLTISTSAPGCLHPIEQLADRNFDIGLGDPHCGQRQIWVLASDPRSVIGFPTSRNNSRIALPPGLLDCFFLFPVGVSKFLPSELFRL